MENRKFKIQRRRMQIYARCKVSILTQQICVKYSTWEACHKNEDYLEIFHVKFTINNLKTKNFLSTINNLL